MMLGNKINGRVLTRYVLGLLILAVLLVFNLQVSYADGNGQFKSLDEVHNVEGPIYVQHDENNANVYDLKKSGTGSTIIYKEIYPTFTAATSWTKDGRFISGVSEDWINKCNATALSDYISVKEGEEYFISTYGVGGAKNADGTYVFQTPVLLTDAKGNVIEHLFTDTFSKTKAGKEFTIPAGATRMYITMYNNQSFRLQLKLNVTDAQFDKMIVNKEELEADIDKNYAEYVKNPTVYEKLDKACITFVNDDTRSGVDKLADLFTSKGVPLVLATCPEALIENSSGLKETRLQSVRRIVAAGGEVMVHNATTVTADNMNDYSTMYATFVKSKQVLQNYGFEINGIILAGGTGLVYDNDTVAKWGNYFYSYSDLYGRQYDKKELALDSVYYHWRGGVLNAQNNMDKLKKMVDDAIENKSWQVIYFHDYNEITEENLAELIDYVKSKSPDEVDIVTYKEMYEKHAVKESTVLENKTYYVSVDGKSAIGTDSNNPMSFETAKNKTFTSGDTILFKRGDVFYGNFSPKIMKVDDDVTVISSYGKGALPVFCGYKIVSSADSWEQYSEGVWRVNLKDTTKFSGVSGTDYTTNQIGFIEYGNGKILGKLRANTEWLEYENNFTSDGTFFYIKTPNNPYDTFGTMKLATKTNMFLVSSNMKVSNICIRGTGAHGILGSSSVCDNIEISGNVIENIGGSYLRNTTRYGNGIEFYEADTSNVLIKNNIIRNVYDVAFTMQGNKGSSNNIRVVRNLFVSNTQDSEIWGGGDATGVVNYQFAENISINQGRGWGYEARLDKYPAAHILFWGYTIENTDIYFHHNVCYNPRRLYYMANAGDTYLFYKNNDYIKTDYNTYYMADDTLVFRDEYDNKKAADFVSDYNKETHSTFTYMSELGGLTTGSTVENDNIQRLATTTYDIQTVRELIDAGHTDITTTVTKATTKADGYITKKCRLCGDITSKVKINKIASVSLSKTSITYTGSALRPAVTVKDSKGAVISSANYTVKYSNNAKVGKATVNIIFKGNYSGTVNRYFNIVPKSTTIKSYKNLAKGCTITWNKVSGATKYNVYRRTVTAKGVTGWKLLAGVKTTSYTDTTAADGYTYQYAIYTYSGSYRSELSKVYKVVKVATPKVAAVKTSGGIKVSYGKITGATKYMIYRKTASSGWTCIKTTTGLGYVDKTAKKGIAYYYGVVAINGNYRSAVGASGKIILLSTPNVKVSKVTNGIKVAYSKITGAANYKIYRKTSKGSYTLIKTTTATGFVDKTAKKGISYVYKVIGISGKCQSSAGVSATIKR